MKLVVCLLAINFQEWGKISQEWIKYSYISILQMLLTNLTANQEYMIYIQALTASLYKEDLVYEGKVSETHTLVVSKNCDGILVSPMREEELRDNAMVSLAIVVGASTVFLILLVAVMSLALWR